MDVRLVSHWMDVHGMFCFGAGLLILSLSAHMWVQIPVSGMLRNTHTFCDLLERHRLCVRCSIWLRVVYACSVVSDSLQSHGL